MTRVCAVIGLVCLSVGAGRASAQPLGTFSWQLQPFCNVLTLSVVQQGPVYVLDGYDDLCGDPVRAPASGIATPSPSGSINVGLTIVLGGGAPVHVRAAIDLPGISGSWNDSAGHFGQFAFSAATGGSARPGVTTQIGQRLIVASVGTPLISTRRAGGTLEAPAAVAAGDVLGRLDAQGFDGTVYAGMRAGMTFNATEAWTPTRHGSAIRFYTTSTGADNASTRLAIDDGGQIGIGTLSPLDRLDVRGDIRVGVGTTGCLRDADATILAGVCGSDRRFKRDVVPFDSTLDKLARLTPVHYRWRATEFPERYFGSGLTYGLVAQDVEPVFPELVTTDAGGYRAVNYSKLPLLTIQAVKELKARNDELAARNDELQARTEALESRLAALEAAMKRR